MPTQPEKGKGGKSKGMYYFGEAWTEGYTLEFRTLASLAEVEEQKDTTVNEQFHRVDIVSRKDEAVSQKKQEQTQIERYFEYSECPNGCETSANQKEEQNSPIKYVEKHALIR